MTKDVPNLTVNVTLEDDDFEILKQRAKEAGISVEKYLVNDFANDYFVKISDENYNTKADTFDNRVGQALALAYKRMNRWKRNKRCKK